MIPKTLLLAFVCALASPLPVLAQPAPAPAEDGEKKTGETTGNNRFWQATLEGGTFMVALDRIVSVSRHKYVMDGQVIVDEVTVDTTGQALARFYFATPVSSTATGLSVADVTKRAEELLDNVEARTGTNVKGMVAKNYPTTTHAKSIEYQIKSEADLTALLNSVKNAWESGRGRQFSAKK